MASKDFIETVISPKVPLKELWASDDSKASLQNPFLVKPKSVRGIAESAGSDKPYVMINSIPIYDIDYLVIDETSQIPKIKLIFTDMSGAISGPNYPKNDPIVSVYIKTQNPKFKPIRCDFLITRIKTNSDAILNQADMDTASQFIMTGELFIPKIYDNVSKSYSQMNSKNALKTVSEDLDLGFAHNEFDTQDQMSWINVNRNNMYFINHISKHAYLDDDSFFTSFVDKYYHLNFINVAEQLNPANELTYTYENTVDASEFESSKERKDLQDQERFEVSNLLVLTNRDSHRGKPEFIINHGLMGNTGSILKNKGFKKKVYYYDHTLDGENKFTSFFVNPIKIKGYESGNTNIGLKPNNESLQEATTKKWMNIDYGNAHAEWNASVLINDHNNSELNKVKLKVETAGINFQIVRGSGLSVLMYQDSARNLEKDFARTDTNSDGRSDHNLNASDLVPDDILSGRYYVSGVKYIYDKFNNSFPFKTEFQLAKFNWLGENNIVKDA